MSRPLIPALLCALVALVACKSEPPAEPAPAPAEKAAVDAPAERAPAPADEVEVAGDRPGEVGCMDCVAVICRAGGLRLDTAKLDAKGATLTAARLDLEAGGGQALTVPVPKDGLLKPDLSLDSKLDGMPSPTDDSAWKGAQAHLKVDYVTASGAKGSVPMGMAVKVQDCP